MTTSHNVKVELRLKHFSLVLDTAGCVRTRLIGTVLCLWEGFHLLLVPVTTVASLLKNESLQRNIATFQSAMFVCEAIIV